MGGREECRREFFKVDLVYEEILQEMRNVKYNKAMGVGQVIEEGGTGVVVPTCFMEFT